VIRIVIDDDVIASPVPVTDVAQVKRSDAEVKTAKPETTWIAAHNAPAVCRTETAFEAAMLPGMIEMEAGVVSGVIVADPLTVAVDVRSLGMARFIAKRGAWHFLAWRFLSLRFLVRGVFRAGHRAMRRRRTMSRNVSAAYSMAAALMFIMLRQRRQRKSDTCSENYGEKSYEEPPTDTLPSAGFEEHSVDNSLHSTLS